MKPTPTPSEQPADQPTLLAFGAHPDDIEFGCGGVIAREGRAGRKAHFVVCSRGESATNGNPGERQAEAEESARLLGATIEFVELGGDAHMEESVKNSLLLAKIIRKIRPAIVLAPTTVENQHPDHTCLGKLVQRAARLARYGGVKELRNEPSHAIEHLLYYAVTPDAEPKDISPIYFDVSDPEVLSTWKASMEAHRSQAGTRSYVHFQMARAWLNGQRAGVGHAVGLFPNDPILVDSLSQLGKGVRNF